MKTSQKPKTKPKHKDVKRADVLAALWTTFEGKPTTFEQLAEHLKLTAGAASVRLHRLCNEGFMRRISGEKKRPYIYALTEEGKTLAQLQHTMRK